MWVPGASTDRKLAVLEPRGVPSALLAYNLDS
jgi:hypothetical protein